MTRETFLTYIGQRAALIADPGLDGIGHSDSATEDDLTDADHLAAVAEEFADQVDRENTSRVYFPLGYHEAVTVEGSAGVFVFPRAVYQANRRACEARVGEVDAVTDGMVLLGWA